MSILVDTCAIALCAAGLLFFSAGLAGLLRFPDTYTRLHALTKADNVGLGLLLAGLALHFRDPWIAAKLTIVWIAVLITSAAISYLIGNSALRSAQSPWSSEELKDDH